MEPPAPPAYVEPFQRNVVSGRCGGARRRLQNETPCVFLVYKQQAKEIVGACVCTRVCQIIGNETRVTWELTRGVELDTPFHVGKEQAPARGQVFKLTSVAEAAVRTSTCRPGGMLSGHFPEFEAKRFRCFLFSEDHCLQPLFASPGYLTHIDTPKSYVAAAGVDPELVEQHPGARGVDEEEDDMVDAPVAPPGQVPPAGPRVVGIVGEVMQRLRSYFTRCRGGTVAVRYAPAAMLSFLDLASNLKPSASMNNVLACSAGFFSGRLVTNLRGVFEMARCHCPRSPYCAPAAKSWTCSAWCGSKRCSFVSSTSFTYW